MLDVMLMKKAFNKVPMEPISDEVCSLKRPLCFIKTKQQWITIINPMRMITKSTFRAKIDRGLVGEKQSSLKMSKSKLKSLHAKQVWDLFCGIIA